MRPAGSACNPTRRTTVRGRRSPRRSVGGAAPTTRSTTRSRRRACRAAVRSAEALVAEYAAARTAETANDSAPLSTTYRSCVSCVGLSIGATNLVAARADGTSILRRAAAHLARRGPDGLRRAVRRPRAHRRAPTGPRTPPSACWPRRVTDLVSGPAGRANASCVAVPAHWPAHVVDRLRALLPDVPVTSDATAALTALRAHPGLPARGIVALFDFGAHRHHDHARRRGGRLRTVGRPSATTTSPAT